jgi:poly(ADP-ribose) glycohydrolase ARH3
VSERTSSIVTASSLVDRFAGSLLGLAVGDACGAPFEGMPATAIHYDFGGSERLVRHPPVDVLYCTDDTHMTIGVAETLVAHGEIVDATLVDRFVTHYDPARGYGTGARRLLEAARRGEDWRPLATSIFPGGSLGNGAAMRVAPVGLLFNDDLDRVADQATLSALPTHVHPVGIDGARIQAIAVALALRSAGAAFDRAAFFATLIGFAATIEFRDALERAASLTPRDGIAHLGHTLEAHRSVVTAIACFAFDPDDYATVIARAIGLGDDTDTLAAMAGACAGARLGLDAIPTNLLALLEPGLRPRLLDLARSLHRRVR